MSQSNPSSKNSRPITRADRLTRHGFANWLGKQRMPALWFLTRMTELHTHEHRFCVMPFCLLAWSVTVDGRPSHMFYPLECYTPATPSDPKPSFSLLIEPSSVPKEYRIASYFTKQRIRSRRGPQTRATRGLAVRVDTCGDHRSLTSRTSLFKNPRAT